MHPTMLSSEMAYHLALRLVKRHGVVVYRCRNMWEVNQIRERLAEIIRRRHWFTYWVMDDWSIGCLWIRKKPAGAIHFVLEDMNISGVKIALEVRS